MTPLKRFERIFWRVQVKSVITTRPSLVSYRVKTTRGANSTYSVDEIDFLVASVFQKIVGTFSQRRLLPDAIRFASALNRQSAG